MFNDILGEKIIQLTKILKSYGSLAVSLSGGVDSAFLLTFARKVLKTNLLAITARSVIHFDHDLRDAIRLTEKLSVNHVFFDSKEMFLDDFVLNGKDRCYFCKKNMLKTAERLALENGFTNVAHGANAEDLNDYRPGFMAADEIGVFAPLIEANFSKADVRTMAKYYKVDVWNKPAMACLATRFPYGTKIDFKAIDQVKKAELILLDAGFDSCRVRHHGDVARIEIDSSCIHYFASSQIRWKIVEDLKKIGYSYVALDLEGYIQGSMNRSIAQS